jgi:hypothetical protein
MTPLFSRYNGTKRTSHARPFIGLCIRPVTQGIEILTVESEQELFSDNLTDNQKKTLFIIKKHPLKGSVTPCIARSYALGQPGLEPGTDGL